jgi:hypothetical protein
MTMRRCHAESPRSYTNRGGRRRVYLCTRRDRHAGAHRDAYGREWVGVLPMEEAESDPAGATPHEAGKAESAQKSLSSSLVGSPTSRGVMSEITDEKN